MPEDKYCAGCGIPLDLRSMEGIVRPVCPQCGRVVYYDPKVAATAVVERAGLVLMLRRAVQTGYGLWSLPGGYVDRGEVVEEAAAGRCGKRPGYRCKYVNWLDYFQKRGIQSWWPPMPRWKREASWKPGRKPWSWDFTLWRVCQPWHFPGTG